MVPIVLAFTYFIKEMKCCRTKFLPFKFKNIKKPEIGTVGNLLVIIDPFPYKL